MRLFRLEKHSLLYTSVQMIHEQTPSKYRYLLDLVHAVVLHIVAYSGKISKFDRNVNETPNVYLI